MKTDVRRWMDYSHSNISISSTTVEGATFGRSIVVGDFFHFSHPIPFLLDLLQLLLTTERRLCSRYSPLCKGGLCHQKVRKETQNRDIVRFYEASFSDVPELHYLRKKWARRDGREPPASRASMVANPRRDDSRRVREQSHASVDLTQAQWWSYVRGR